ncbi:uncharacterized protein RAG0_04840 [Rhynchosporium agropyri]|uniref:Uncharacterized protein n=1 Tax=Rhynchosporium agropyri TaxID=914238 RepID=A0A1E1KAK3_9HELO|nr:uncharacterized protein RAG0_04840 [Rhynchosporium agropyri]
MTILSALILAGTKEVACALPKLRDDISFGTVPITSHVEFQELGTLQTMLEEIEEPSADVTLPLPMKRGENAIREIAAHVETSILPVKNEIGERPRESQQTTSIAGDDVRTIDSHLDRTINSIISTKEETLRYILREREVDSQAVKLQHMRHLSKVNDDIDALIIETEPSVVNLQQMESPHWRGNQIGSRDILNGNVEAALTKVADTFGAGREEVKALENQSKIVPELLKQKHIAVV